jgi:alcohol dehydrogenase
MKAARMHDVGSAMRIEDVPLPTLNSNDVLVRVRSCGIVPNLGNVLRLWTTWFPERPLPPLPAIFGLDPAGEIAAVGSQVHAWKPGDRVYVNPGRHCGGCRACRDGLHNHCEYYTFNGYFGFTEKSMKIFADYPYGGLCEYMSAPQYALVGLPDNVSFDAAARLGYVGTAYAGLRKADARPGKTVMISGASGTLGLGAVLIALALGVTRILGVARDPALLARVKALAPDRIEVKSVNDGGPSVEDWVREVTRGEGLDIYLDCIGPGGGHAVLLSAMRVLKRGGKAVNTGAISGDVPIDMHNAMDMQNPIIGSCWFTAGEGQDMADMAGAGTLRLDVFEHTGAPLADINQAISGIAGRNGGFSNFVIHP